VPSPFHLSCLGEPQLFDSAGEAIRFRTRKHFALLIRLALEPGRAFARDALTELLWPDVSPKRARHSLSQAVTVLRAKLGRENLLVRTASLGLRAGAVETDVAQLANGTDGTIRGRFLDGFEVPQSRPFDDWKDQWSAHLVPQVRDALTRHMDAARRIADFATVERHAQLLHDLDATSEEAVRGLMESRAWVGDRTNALKIFARYEALLAAELGAKPSADLVRMAHLLRDGRGALPRPAEPGQPPSPAHRRFEPEMLIGREREFGALYDAWLDVRRRNPRIMVVLGDPGIGKTTLCNSFAASCQMEGAVVARVQAYDAERELPFAVVSELVRQLVHQGAVAGADPEALSELTRICGEITTLLPGVPKPTQWAPELVPLRLADAFLKTLTAAAEDSPTIVVVDDVHAADHASAAILHTVARKVAAARILMILTGRPPELRMSGVPGALTSDANIQGFRSLELEPLVEGAIHEFVDRLVATSDKPHARPDLGRIVNASRGNPLAIELLTREWLEHGHDSLLHQLDAIDTQPPPSIGIPKAIRAVLEQEVVRLASEPRAALDLAAVLGPRLRDLSLYTAIDLKPGRAAEALTRLRDEGFLREVSGRLEFRNELARAHAYFSIVGPARQQLHRRVAELLSAGISDDGESNLEVAWHFIRGGASLQALAFALKGATASLKSGAHFEAERMLVALLEHPWPNDIRAEMSLLLAKALLAENKANDALALVAPVIDGVSSTIRGRAEAMRIRAAAEYQLNRGGGSSRTVFAAEALEAAKATEDPDLIARALLEYVRAAADSGDDERLLVARDELASLSKRGGDNLHVRYTDAYFRYLTYDLTGAAMALDEALKAYNGSASVAEIAMIQNSRGACLAQIGNADDSVTALRAALAIAERIGDDATASSVCANLCTTLLTVGRVAEALAFGKRSLSLGGQSTTQSNYLNAFVSLADAYTLLGDKAEVLKCLDLATEWMGSERSWRTTIEYWAESACIALTFGNHAVALSAVDAVERHLGKRTFCVPNPSTVEKLRTYKAALTLGFEAALPIADQAKVRFRPYSVTWFLNAVAAKAWIEKRFLGAYSEETEADLQLFDRMKLTGKKRILEAQGFLT